MGIFSKQDKKEWLSKAEQKQIVSAIQQAEALTSGEIRVFIEPNCTKPVMERAQEIFFKLKMDATLLHNGVLIYLAYDDHQFCILGDEGINEKTGGIAFWEKEVAIAIKHFKNKEYVKGLSEIILDIGKSLTEHFPYDKATDKNELPDEIVFG